MAYATSIDQIIASLETILDRLRAMAPMDIPSTAVSFDLQITSHRTDAPERARLAAATELCRRFLECEAGTRSGSGDSFGAPLFGVDIGAVNCDIFTSVKSQRERELADENDRLRAELEAAKRAADVAPSPEEVAGPVAAGPATAPDFDLSFDGIDEADADVERVPLTDDQIDGALVVLAGALDANPELLDDEPPFHAAMRAEGVVPDFDEPAVETDAALLDQLGVADPLDVPLRHGLCGSCDAGLPMNCTCPDSAGAS